MRPDEPRDPIVGPDSGPEPPFPIKLSGEVIKGFGRGSKELGIPTANIPIEGLAVGGNEHLESGVYFGWAGLDFHSSGGGGGDAGGSAKPHDEQHQGLGSLLKDATAKVAEIVGAMIAGDEDDAAEEGLDGKGRVHPMVMSVGWNPYYKNEKRSVEVHMMHEFTHDFYGSHMNLIMLGFIRPEYDYVSKESLIEDIKVDIEVSGRSLARKQWAKYRRDPYLLTFPESQQKQEEKDKPTT